VGKDRIVKGEKKEPALLIGIGPKPKDDAYAGLGDMDDMDEEMGEDEYSQLKLDSADAIKMALKSNDTRSLIDALDAYLRC
jgi:hypothetical protein